MPKYVIHVGMTKTGSTHLQVSLRDMARELRARGVLYPSDWWTDSKDIHHGALFRSLFDPRSKATEAIFAGLNAEAEQTIVLSCEGFYGLIPTHLAELRALMAGHQVEIVIYLRRWSDWIPSHWQQVVKSGGTETFPEAYVRLFRDPDALPIGYLRILDNLASVFGHDAIRIVSYSNLMSSKQDIVRHFCEQILHLPELGGPGEGGTANPSTGVHATELVRWLNAWCLARGKPSNVGNGRTVMRYWDRLELRDDNAAIGEAMEAYRTQITINDGAFPLAAQYDQLMQRYGANIVNPGPGGELFDLRAREIAFIRPDWLVPPGIAERLDWVAPILLEWARTPPRSAKPYVPPAPVAKPRGAARVPVPRQPVA